MPLNLDRLRRSNNARLRQYERFGIRVFTEALKLQAVPNPSAMPMQEAYIRFYQEVFVDAAKREYNRIRMQEKAFVPSDFFLNTWREWIKSWVIENLGFLITEVTETTRKRVQAILGEAIEQGLNPTQTQDLLLQEIPDIKRARAIARTESTRANNMGKKRSATEYANQSGDVLYKVWIWGGSRDPRLEHVSLQNKPIRADQNFIGINGKPMDVPGDKQGGPENTINCSCSVVYISERLARRRYPDAFQNVPITPNDDFVFGGQIINMPINMPYRVANSIDEAKDIARNIINTNTPLRVNRTYFHEGLTLDQYNKYNRQIDQLTREYNLSPHLDSSSEISLMYRSTNFTYGFVESTSSKITKINFGHKVDVKSRTNPRVLIDERGRKEYAKKSKADPENAELSTITHEFAHVISTENSYVMAKYPDIKSFWEEIKKLRTAYRRELGTARLNDQELERVFLGDYANTNLNEFMAEAFTEYKLSSNPTKYALEVGKLIDKYFKKG